jgi:hypothetical protein
MGTIELASKDVYDLMHDLISRYHPDLALAEIVILIKEKATKKGDVLTVGVGSKVAPWVSALGEATYHFKIEIGGDAWADFTPKQKVALLDHHLCGFKAEEQEDGSIKFFTVPPDVIAYQDEIDRHGVWRVQGEPAERNMILEMFGLEDDGEDKEDKG